MSTATAPTVAVAFSGGRDSLALLHATVRAARPLGLQVLALHVHHGLLPEADAWERRVRRLCARWAAAGWPLRLRCHRLVGAPAPGDSLEAWARRGRRAALAAMAVEEGASLLLLAQHRRDQAETVLLQALRGAGPRGLAAMPAVATRDGLVWARPWLDHPREAVDAYIARHRLRPVEDPTNADPRFARGRLRQQVWPALRQAFPEAEACLAEVARRAAEADAVLQEMGAADLALMADASGLHRARWLGLSAARRTLVLRAWLTQVLPHGAPQALVLRLSAEWPEQPSGRWPARAGWTLVAHRGVLRVSESEAPPGPPLRVDLSRPGRVEAAGWGGHWQVDLVAQGGIALAALARAELRPREPAVRFQRAPGTPPRSLKKQYQFAGLSTDQRQGPLVWIDGQLAYVPGLGVDARWLAPSGAPQARLRWHAGSSR